MTYASSGLGFGRKRLGLPVGSWSPLTHTYGALRQSHLAIPENSLLYLPVAETKPGQLAEPAIQLQSCIQRQVIPTPGSRGHVKFAWS